LQKTEAEKLLGNIKQSERIVKKQCDDIVGKWGQEVAEKNEEMAVAARKEEEVLTEIQKIKSVIDEFFLKEEEIAQIVKGWMV